MFSYKKENSWNEKLMGWEGGITAKEKLHGLEPAQPRSAIQNSSIPGPALQKCPHTREKLSWISNPCKWRKKEWYRQERIPGSVLQSTLVHLKSNLCATENPLSSPLFDLICFIIVPTDFAKYLLWVMMKPVWITRISDLPLENSVKLGFYCVKLNKFHP